MVFRLLVILIGVLFIGFVYGVIKCSWKLTKKLVKNKVLSCILAFIPLILVGIGLYYDTVDSITVNLYLMVIVLLTKLVFFIIQKISKKNFNDYTSIIVGVLITTIVMCWGYYSVYNIKETDYAVSTTKDIDSSKLRIVAITDSHIGTTIDGKDLYKYVEKINMLNPDLVVLVGDFVDDVTLYEEMKEAASSLGNLKTKYGVYFAYGNHDRGYYNSRDFKDKELREELTKNNIVILQDDIVNITDNVVLVGREDFERSRKSIADLTKEIDEDKYTIVLDHQPNDFTNEKNANVDLVISGHTHGGQVFPLGPIGVLIGANDEYYGLFKRDNTNFVVSSGISDWAMKFKVGAISEYVVIDVTNQ